MGLSSVNPFTSIGLLNVEKMVAKFDKTGIACDTKRAFPLGNSKLAFYLNFNCLFSISYTD